MPEIFPPRPTANKYQQGRQTYDHKIGGKVIADEPTNVWSAPRHTAATRCVRMCRRAAITTR
jgi:hypothetical protein